MPADRYATAQEFADDLQRFLDDRPIHARRPSLPDRAAKWVRRHRAVTSGAVLALLVAAVGLAVGIGIVLREHGQTKAALDGERRANERERERAAEAAAGRAEAEDNYRRTRRAVDLFVELSDEELLDFPPFAPFRQRLLEAAVAYYQELSDRREDASVRADLDASRIRLARLQDELAALTDFNTVLLLDQSVVRTELELTDAQAARLAPVLARLRAFQRMPIARAEGGKRKPAIEQVAAARREIGGVLTATQYDRLRQVSLQIPGPHVFGADTVAALGLSDAQKGLVRRVHAEATQASLRQFITAADRDTARVEFDRLWKCANEQIVAALTPAQAVRWADMTGPPVRGAIRFPMPESDGRK